MDFPSGEQDSCVRCIETTSPQHSTKAGPQMQATQCNYKQTVKLFLWLLGSPAFLKIPHEDAPTVASLRGRRHSAVLLKITYVNTDADAVWADLLTNAHVFPLPLCSLLDK